MHVHKTQIARARMNDEINSNVFCCYTVVSIFAAYRREREYIVQPPYAASKVCKSDFSTQDYSRNTILIFKFKYSCCRRTNATVTTRAILRILGPATN